MTAVIRPFRFFLAAICFSSIVVAQDLYFPPPGGTTWETVGFTTLGWDTTQVDSLYRFLDSANTRAFIVLKHGRIAVEKYFRAFTRDSVWYWASAGKTLTALLVGVAQQEGYLSIADSTSRWLGGGWTSCPPGKEALITVRHQLTMTSGLDDGVPDPYCTEPACLQYLADAGTRWAYHNGPYTLLDSVIRSATGRTLNQFFQTRVATKTGMTGAFFRSGYNNVFFSTARSMARFGLLVLHGGRWDTTAVLADSSYFAAMVNTSQSLNPSYGYLWWLNGKASYMLPQTQFVFPGPLNPAAPPDMIAALGKNGQFINVVPSMGLVFIRMGDAPDGSLVPFTLNNMIWERLLPVIRPTREYRVAEGWNMVSVPLTIADYTTTAVYPTAISGAFAYSGGYVSAPVLESGRGYWLKFADAQNVSMQGELRSVDTVDVAEGWNLVGSISFPVDVDSIATIPGGIVLSPFYGFGPTGYAQTSFLEPGKAYWVKSPEGARIILRHSVGQSPHARDR